MEGLQHVQTFGRGDRIGLGRARLNLLGRVCGLVTHDIDPSAEQVSHGRAGSLVWNRDEWSFNSAS